MKAKHVKNILKLVKHLNCRKNLYLSDIEIDKLSAKYNILQEDVNTIISKKCTRRLCKEEIEQKTYTEVLRQRLCDFASTIPRSGYSMGDLKLLSLDGVNMKNIKIWGEYSTQETYRGSAKKWRPTYGYIRVKIPKHFFDAEIIGGLITKKIKAIKKDLYKVQWIKYKTQGYKGSFSVSVVTETGYLYKLFHAKTLKEIKKYKKNERKKIALENKLTKIEKKALNFRYSYNDSIASGNCEAGTRAFVIKYRLDKTKTYKGAYLQKLAQNDYQLNVAVKRMISYKQQQMMLNN